MKRILRLPAMQAVSSWLLGTYLILTLRTTRWELHGETHLAPFAEGGVVIAASALAACPDADALGEGTSQHPGEAISIHMLVSHHRDGTMIGSILHRFGVHVLRGSSSGGGVTSMRNGITLLKNGRQVAITPDGPRGPRRVAAAGVAQIAALSGAPVLPCSAQVSRRHVLRSWDRMVFPLPFGRGVLVCEPPVLVPRNDWESSLPIIVDAMTAAADRADSLCDI